MARNVIMGLVLAGALLVGTGAIALSSAVDDDTPPEIKIFIPRHGDVYVLHQPVEASWDVSDPEPSSGIKAVLATAPDGEPIDTATVGRKTFRVFAVDEAGNAASAAVHYRVIYRAEILAPLPQAAFAKTGVTPLLSARQGDLIPFAISIRDFFDAVIPSAVGTLTALDAATRAIVSVDDGIIGVFRYDGDAGLYRYTMDTSRLEPGRYEIIVQFNDVVTIYRIAFELAPSG
jgi:hypothetical protein